MVISKCLNAGVGDATPLEGDEKLPNMTSLQLLKIQEPSHEQDSLDVQSDHPTYLRNCEAELEEVSGHESVQQSKVLFKTNDTVQYHYSRIIIQPGQPPTHCC